MMTMYLVQVLNENGEGCKDEVTGRMKPTTRLGQNLRVEIGVHSRDWRDVRISRD